MTPEQLVELFNEWQRQYIENPDGFLTDDAIKAKFLADLADGAEPTYGHDCVATLLRIQSELDQ